MCEKRFYIFELNRSLKSNKSDSLSRASDFSKLENHRNFSFSGNMSHMTFDKINEGSKFEV